MFIIINENNQFYSCINSGDFEFTTDFAKANVFSAYKDAIKIAEKLNSNGANISVSVETL